MKKDFTYREIPYNYTSFSDKEIILKYFDEESWAILDELRHHRVTGRSAKLLFEIIGDIFIIDRNPYIFNDFLENPSKQTRLKKLHDIRFRALDQGATESIVKNIINRAKEVDHELFHRFSHETKRRKQIINCLKHYTDRKNIHFSAFHKVTHVTDATDWRVEYPEVVVYPDHASEIPGIIKAAQKLSLKIIPRGGGTGLTGGAIPIYRNTMVINTEKLRAINGITITENDGKKIPVIKLDTGVITETAMNYSITHGYIFATDPTSAWASTIGGNISENAGGKKCVIWGTAIDNIYSYDIVNASGSIIRVQRRNHPHRKILPDDKVLFDIYETHEGKTGTLLNTVELKGTEIRKKGVGKDITNKALNGLPGIQKEGGDGIITSAEFVLYQPFGNCLTVCLEFFGKNLINASKAIIDILSMYEKDNNCFLTALEHFDEKYVTAIRYRNKSERAEFPKAVLLIDIESNDAPALEKSAQKLIKGILKYNAEGFIAIDPKERELFWKDRKNLGAIARHTNAFKLNEDVVIPIESLPSFADYIEQINSRKEIENYIYIISRIKNILTALKTDNDPYLSNKLKSYSDHTDRIKSDLELFADNLTLHLKKIKTSFYEIPGTADKKSGLFENIREGKLELKFKEHIIDQFISFFHGYEEILSEFNETVNEASKKKIIVATHMHAGDGNIHVNIPVNSNDYAMMQEADSTAGDIMNKTKELGGVISGEHGIGLTKIRFIDRENLDEYSLYKDKADPSNLFNPGKLNPDFPQWMIYTPSLNLLEMEAFILKAADLEDLTISISGCVRCGKCKEVCNTHYPCEAMFYSPRNKILGVSLITEAVLYEAQREKNLSFRNFRMLREIANHCTMCHNCFKPCPVDIDFGEVTLAIKKLLVDRKRSSFKPLTWLTLFYLKCRGLTSNIIFRIILLKAGFSAQRVFSFINRPFSKITERISPFINALLMRPFPESGKRSLRETFKLRGSNTFFSFENPGLDIKKSVFYFPGCGSERMFPDISFATIALLYHAGIRVVIAPEFLCCGYPLKANGKTILAETKSNENRVIFHRIADTVSYMEIQDILVTCGTCREMLTGYNLHNVFPGSSLIDASEFLIQENLYNTENQKIPLLYHDPCHSPMQTFGAEKTIHDLFGCTPVKIDNCCGEGGTLALSTPAIAENLRKRKIQNIIEKKQNNDMEILTSCPSCVGGLNKLNGADKIRGEHIIIAAAKYYLGNDWKNNFIHTLKKDNGIESIIL